MDKTEIYISLDQSVLVPNKKVCLEDISTLFCIDTNLLNNIKSIELFTFTDSEIDQKVITIMKIIEVIKQKFPNVTVINTGAPETIIYYKNLKNTSKYAGKVKVFFLLLLAFFGTAYSIMSYNGDVGSITILQNIYQLFTGQTANQHNPWYIFGLLSYSIGLCIGMIVFFNHGINSNKADDPTPLQVQMRLYEGDVNSTIILNSERNGKTLDIK